MSVINTNITSLIAQQNLGKSQNSLATAMERLSSGMRINSAKDDAAGQAIANRMTAQITGLSQAQRNANDGISVAQTAEGALNQINDNLQRIRELTVQGQNDTNSDADLTSIQDEITQRLNEINRISEQTDFNGTKVLSDDVAFRIQVGANDGEYINVGLQEITSSTLGVGSFSVEDMRFSTDISAALTSVAIRDVESAVTLSIAANSFSIGTQPVSSNISAGDFFETTAGSTLVTLASDGNYYEVSENTVTGQYSFDSSSVSGFSASDVGEALSSLEVAVATAAANAGTVAGQSVSGFVGLTVDSTAGTTIDDFFGDNAAAVIGNIYERTDVENGYAIKGADGNFYAIDVSGDDTEFGIALENGIANPTQWVQVSSENVGIVATEIVTGTEALPTGGDILNQDIVAGSTDAPTGTGVYAISDPTSYGGAEYAVLASDGQYYAASLDETTGEMSWNSTGTSSIVASGDITGGDLNNTDLTLEVQQSVNMTGATASAAGLGTGETLHTDADGNYVVKGQDSSGNTTYNQATVADNGDGTVTITKADALTVDALATLDNALSKVDQLRSDLGAVQNRFSDAINNLNTNETNLQAARSRIEDTDYALEVANMTRAQILQQAGTSVLAQANQLPQNVLSLLG